MTHYVNYCISFSCNFPVYFKQITAAENIKDIISYTPGNSFQYTRTTELGLKESEDNSFYMKMIHYYLMICVTRFGVISSDQIF